MASADTRAHRLTRVRMKQSWRCGARNGFDGGMNGGGRFWSGRRVLVTGHTGFKGAWLSAVLEELGADVSGLALPPEHLGSAFTPLSQAWGVRSRFADIRDRAALKELIVDEEPEVILHLAAQALVGRGYDDPIATYETNALGTANVLEAARSSRSTRVVLVVTTDKVYEHGGRPQPFSEDDPLGGSDPYSSSKVCAEHVVRTWRRSFLADAGVAVGVARAGNVIGGGDCAPGRLLPDLFRALDSGEPLRLRRPDAQRPWQFVLEPLLGYLLYAEALATEPASAPEALNFGPPPSQCWRVSEVVEHVFQIWGGGTWLPAKGDGVPEMQALKLDSSLATKVLGWRSKLDLPEALRWTCDWHRDQRDGGDLASRAAHQIEAYRCLGLLL